jgi:hypothetical protein
VGNAQRMGNAQGVGNAQRLGNLHRLITWIGISMCSLVLYVLNTFGRNTE